MIYHKLLNVENPQGANKNHVSKSKNNSLSSYAFVPQSSILNILEYYVKRKIS